MRVLPVILLLLAPLVLAGCTQDTPAPASHTNATTAAVTPTPTPEPSAYQKLGFDGKTWPSLNSTTLTILDHGAFGAFSDAAKLFENLTGAKVVEVKADDTGSALNRAVQEKGSPTFDVIYGVDNILWTKAVMDDVFQPYKPLLASRIAPAYVFFDANGPWYATPVDHGYIGVNVDPRANVTVASLADLPALGAKFATEDPRTSTPGLGFLLATIATYGETSNISCERAATEGRGCGGWKAYWNDLFHNHTLVTSGWTEAYEQHFSGGYGVDYGGKGDRAIVTSYTESPAYEHFFGRATQNLSLPLVAPNSTFHQVQTMGIAKGTKHLAAAEAWIEFALTDGYQGLAAPGNAVYPVVASVNVTDTYGGIDPAPGTFQPARLSSEEIGANVERWVHEWTALCEAANCA